MDMADRGCFMKFTEAMVVKDQVTFVGSDIHSGRKFRIKKCVKKIKKLAGAAKARELTEINPLQILKSSAEMNRALCN